MTNDTRSSTPLGRRAVLGGGALASATMLAACLPGSGGQGESWDEEFDVVVVGSGAAASAAAVHARAAGGSVLVLEKMPVAGGTTGKSGGVAWIPNNRFIRARGVEDRKADAMRYMVRYSYPTRYAPEADNLGISPAEYALIEAFYDHGSASIDALEKIGAVQFKPFEMFAVNKPAPDYADHLPENKVPTGRAIEPASGAGGTAGGNSLAAQMHRWLKDKGVAIRTGTPVTRIVREGDRVTGVVTDDGKAQRRVRAKKGVIFGTGGYAHNVELIHQHQLALYGSCASPGATGDFIALTQEIGAAMGNLGSAWRSQIVLEDALKQRQLVRCADYLPGDSMLVVNRFGKRAVNEKRDYNDRTKAHFTYDPTREDYPNQILFMIFDERSRDSFGGSYPFPTGDELPPAFIKAETLGLLTEQIAGRLRAIGGQTGGVTLDPGFGATLQGEVTRFNGYATSGTDPDFLRGLHAYDREWHLLFSARRPETRFPANPYPNITMHPLAGEGPYYCIMLSAGALDTNGGPQINEKAQVLDARGKPLAGLYGAGNCVASPSREAYYGAGCTIGLALTYGYIAANHTLAEG